MNASSMGQNRRDSTGSPGRLLRMAGLSFVLAMAGFPSASAQEAASAEESESAPPQSTQSPGDAPGKKKAAGGEVFVPTEEISEDYAVSFPVDI